MKTVIYADILVILNIYVTYFAIRGAVIFLHRKSSVSRTVIGALIGGIFSLTALLPALPVLVSIIVKLSEGVIVSMAALCFKKPVELLKNTLAFLLVNALFAGITLLIWLFFAPLGMTVSNGYVYFDISFLTIVIATVISFFTVKFLRYFLDIRSGNEYSAIVMRNGSTITLPAIADTGNGLCDFTSGLPVIVCERRSLLNILPEHFPISADDAECIFSMHGLYVIPYTTVGGDGMMFAFRPDEVKISDGKHNKSVSALIGVSNADINGKAIFNPKILI